MVITGTIIDLYELKCRSNKNLAIAKLKRSRNTYSLIIFNSVWKNGMCAIKNGNYVSLEVKPDKHSGDIKYIVQRLIEN